MYNTENSYEWYETNPLKQKKLGEYHWTISRQQAFVVEETGKYFIPDAASPVHILIEKAEDEEAFGDRARDAIGQALAAILNITVHWGEIIHTLDLLKTEYGYQSQIQYKPPEPGQRRVWNPALYRRLQAGTKRFAAIREKLQVLHELGGTVSLVPVEAAEILQLERRLRKCLPAEYVSFLFHIGTGRAGRYAVFSPREVWDRYRHFCSLEKYFNRRYAEIASFEDLTIELVRRKAVEMMPGFAGFVTVGVKSLAAAAIPVVDRGCVGMNMLVFRGPAAGTVWNTACERIYSTTPQVSAMKQPFPQQTLTFIPWMEAWLDSQIELRKDKV